MRHLPEAAGLTNDDRSIGVRAPESELGAAELGDMPAWNLADLYTSAQSPELTRDLQEAADGADAFAARYQGKLDALAQTKGSAGLFACIKDYEALQDLIGRIGSFAYLNYVTKADDPERAKFFGDMQEQLTNIGSKLLFFGLELNRIDDALLERIQNEPPLDHYRPWLEELRKEKPYQLADDLERLFHEKAMTGRAGWSRLFSETMTALRFDIDGHKLPIEPTLNRLVHPDETVRRKAADDADQGFQGQSAAVYADHQYSREGQGDFGSLARFQGRRRLTASGQQCRAGSGRGAGDGGARALSAHFASLLRDEGALDG